jgi:acetolactate synthase I/II/III large subunit
VLSNAKARGAVPEMNHLGYGSFALAASPLAIAEAGGPPDVVMLLGARIGMFVATGAQSLIPPDATVIQVDIEPEEIGRGRDVDVGLVGDVRQTLLAMLDRSMGRSFKDHAAWIRGLAAARDAMWRMHATAMPREAPVHQARMAYEVAQLIGGDGIIVADGGETSLWMAEQAIVLNVGDWMSHGYLGCLGVGLPFGIAAKVAHPDRRVVVVTGDGSLGLNIAEFDTAVRHGIPIVVVVNNDQGWGMIRHGQAARYGPNGVVGAELGPVRYDEVAAGFGAHAELVENASDLRPALERAFASGRPACVNVLTDPAQPHATSVAVATAKPKKDEVHLPYYGKKTLVAQR